jgi:hypothetical protein
MTEPDITPEERQLLGSYNGEAHSLSSRQWEKAYDSVHKKKLLDQTPTVTILTPKGQEAINAFDRWLLSVPLSPCEVEALRSAYGHDNSFSRFTTAERTLAWMGLKDKGMVCLYGVEYRLTSLGRKRLLTRNVVRVTTRTRPCLPT